MTKPSVHFSTQMIAHVMYYDIHKMQAVNWHRSVIRVLQNSHHFTAKVIL